MYEDPRKIDTIGTSEYCSNKHSRLAEISRLADICAAHERHDARQPSKPEGGGRGGASASGVGNKRGSGIRGVEGIKRGGVVVLNVGSERLCWCWLPARGPLCDCAHPRPVPFFPPHQVREWITRTQVHATPAPSTSVAVWASTPQLNRAPSDVKAAAKQAARGAAVAAQQARMLGLQRAASAESTQSGGGMQAPKGERDLSTR